MKFLTLLIFYFSLIKLSGQTLFNAELSKRIDSLVEVDQKWRNLDISMAEKERHDTIYSKFIRQNWQVSYSLNLIVAKSIIKKYGFPGFDLVGQNSSNNFWLLIQHADDNIQFQELCLNLLSKQVDKKNANVQNYAYLVDRVKVNKKERQIYGTQMWLNKDQTSFIVPDVVDPINLNKRRKSVGLEPIEKYIATMNETYKKSLKKQK